MLKLFEEANNQINTVKDGFDKNCFTSEYNYRWDETSYLFLSIYITFAVMALLGNITVGQFNELAQITCAMYDNIIGLSSIISDYRRDRKWLRAFWQNYDAGVSLSEKASSSNHKKRRKFDFIPQCRIQI